MSRIAEAAWGDTPLGQQYPHQPGYKARETARDAAVSMALEATVLRERVLAAIKAAGVYGLTADEAAEKVGRTVLTIRPRVSELNAQNRIVPTGERRANVSGRSAMAWRAA